MINCLCKTALFVIFRSSNSLQYCQCFSNFISEEGRRMDRPEFK